MQTPALAATLLAAGLLSACGFTPPAPPKPSDSNRIAINRVDPRLVGQESGTVAPTPAVVGTQITASGPVTPTVRPGAMPTSAAPAAQPSPMTVAVAPIPVPSAPEPVQKQAVDAPAAPATAASQPVTPPPAPATQSATAAPPTATSATPTTAADPTPLEPAKAALQEPAPVVQTVTVATASSTPTDAARNEPAAEPPAEPPVIKRLWHISPSDGTVRQALTRWAAAENWTFGPDQWELTFDLPIQAPAEFEAESFQEATQALSQAIAMTESPIRPCFYGNRVLRVIPFTRSCNRSPATQS